MTMNRAFPHHTLADASGPARALIAGSERMFGFLPSPVARLATQPAVATAFTQMNAAFEKTSLGSLEREVVIMTIARENRCHYCVAMHSALLARDAAHAAVLAALRDGTPLPDARLDALARFVRALLAGRGDVSDDAWRDFIAAGFDHAAALEVVLGVATYTLSTFANRLTQAPLDPPFEPFRWPEPRATSS